MLQVLIVDDEPIFRLGIRSSVPWEKMDCTVCGEASNGEEALQMIYEKKPDVVFLDIKMPLMDGIEVLRKLSGKNQDIYFVILSCFNEYDYVREAMKLGAFDYLFKPVMGVKELKDVLMEIKNKINQKNKTEQKNERENYFQILEILKNGIYREITDKEQQKLKELDSNIMSLPFSVISVQIIKNGNIVQAGSSSMDTCKAIISQYIENEILYFVSPEEQDHLLIIYFSDRFFESSEKEWREYWTKIIFRIKDYMDAEVFAGIGSAADSLSSYSRCVQQAVTARKESFFNCEGVNIYREELELSYDFEKIYEHIFTGIQESLLKKDLGTVYDLLRILKKDVLAHKYFNAHDYCHFLATNMVAFMRKFRSGTILEELLLEDYNLISNIYHQTSIEKTNEEFMRVLQICFQRVHGVSVNSIQETIVNQAMQYIQENYMKKISLNDIADKFHINKNYFCKVFKQVTGINLINYITELRLEKATEMLETTDKKVYEIALEVGFQSYPHFCKTYKKYRNVSPTEIRRKNFMV